jgi:hypothetical protein
MLGYANQREFLEEKFGTYMFDFLHDLHFHVNLLIQYTILHESSLLQFLGSKRDTIKLIGDLVYDGECTFSNGPDLVVLGSASPFFNMSTNR